MVDLPPHPTLFIVSRYMVRTGMPRQGTIIVGLSGGADSVALLLMLTQLGYHCVACHCNFHLRGPESMRDRDHARSIAESLGAEYCETDFDIPAYCKSHPGTSVEMACRELRYEWFEQMRLEHNAQAIAVAHHRDDNIETLFQRLLRSAGVRGLAAMRPVRGHIIRPLLCISRKQIEEYLALADLPYVTDSTNLESVYQRNRLRLDVLPTLYDHFPGAAGAIAESIDHLQQASAFIDAAMAERRSRYVDPEGNIDLASLIDGEGPHAGFVLLYLTEQECTDSSMVENILASATLSGRRFGPYLLDRGRLLRIDNKTTIERPASVLSQGALPEGLDYERVPVDDTLPAPVEPDTLMIDARALEDNPTFELRTWCAGDRIEPFGMHGSKKVSDILRDAKVPLHRKSEVMVLTRNGTVLWLPGLRASRHFPVTPSTKEYLLIKLKK